MRFACLGAVLFVVVDRAEKRMGEFTASKDGVKIHFEKTGNGSTALIFVHGWLGNCRWWDAQRDHFAGKYTVVQMDLAGHGGSGEREKPTVEAYSEDIAAVAEAVGTPEIILVGHSMAGAYALPASLRIPRAKAIVAVDTLKMMDQVLTSEQAEEYLFGPYRKDFHHAVENLLPQFLFAGETPPAVKERLTREFLSVEAGKAIRLLAPLYGMDVRAAAREVKIPVRAINSDYTPTSLEANRKYFGDYDFRSIAGTGHYPMLEKPGEFNRLLGEVLGEIN